MAQEKSLKERLIGIWTLVSFDTIEASGIKHPGLEGANLKGLYIFTDSGRASFQSITELPKLASNDRLKTTVDENMAVSHGVFSCFGTYTINDTTVAYWQRQKLSQAVIERLTAGAQRWADKAAWQAFLAEQQVTDQRHVRIATEGALLGSLIAHGVSPELTVLSDGAGQFDVFVHALCWLHVERPLGRLVPHNEKHRQAIEKIREGIWDLYAGLKAYRQLPSPSACDALGKQFDALVAQRTDYPSIDGVLKGMAADRAKLLLVLERPEVPLHNNLSEGHIRDYVKKRKISGSTRSELGRRARDTFASLKKTCRRLGVNFWAYLQDRVRGLGQIPRLADQIRQKAEEVATRKAPAAQSAGPDGAVV
jgi:hypothetical protein